MNTNTIPFSLGVTAKDAIAAIKSPKLFYRALKAGWITPHIKGKGGRRSIFNKTDVEHLYERLGKESPPLLPCEKKRQAAFSLTELLGVISVILVLSAVSVTAFTLNKCTSAETSFKRECQVLNSAYQSYIAAGGAILPSSSTTPEVYEALRGKVNGIGPFLITATTEIPIFNLCSGPSTPSWNDEHFGTPTPTPTPTPEPTPEPTATPTASPTATPTATPTASPTPTATPTATPTPEPALVSAAFAGDIELQVGDSALISAELTNTGNHSISVSTAVETTGSASVTIPTFSGVISSGTTTTLSGTVTGISAGNSTVTLTATGPDNTATALCLITTIPTPAPTFTVTYDGNGNTGGEVQTTATYSAGDTVTLPITAPTKTGFSFLNWTATSGLTESEINRPNGTFVMPSQNVTLQASWSTAQFTLSWVSSYHTLPLPYTTQDASKRPILRINGTTGGANNVSITFTSPNAPIFDCAGKKVAGSPSSYTWTGNLTANANGTVSATLYADVFMGNQGSYPLTATGLGQTKTTNRLTGVDTKALAFELVQKASEARSSGYTADWGSYTNAVQKLIEGVNGITMPQFSNPWYSGSSTPSGTWATKSNAQNFVSVAAGATNPNYDPGAPELMASIPATLNAWYPSTASWRTYPLIYDYTNKIFYVTFGNEVTNPGRQDIPWTSLHDGDIVWTENPNYNPDALIGKPTLPDTLVFVNNPVWNTSMFNSYSNYHADIVAGWQNNYVLSNGTWTQVRSGFATPFQ